MVSIIEKRRHFLKQSLLAAGGAGVGLLGGGRAARAGDGGPTHYLDLAEAGGFTLL